MNLTKEEFFKYHYVQITDESITFIKDEVTSQENFVVRTDVIRITLKFIEEAIKEGWLELMNWKSDPPFALYKIINEEIPPAEEASPICPSCRANLLKVDDGYKCLYCGYKSW